MVITLVGFRGTGKSTVAQQLSARLEWPTLDADHEVVARAGKPIAEIFAEDGEPAFRALERQVLTELLMSDRLVLSTGGGAVLDPLVREAMREAGPVIWLTATPATILERLQSDPFTASQRPALTDHSMDLEIIELLQEREPHYNAVASIVVVTDEKDITSIVDEIVPQLPLAQPPLW